MKWAQSEGGWMDGWMDVSKMLIFSWRGADACCWWNGFASLCKVKVIVKIIT